MWINFKYIYIFIIIIKGNGTYLNNICESENEHIIKYLVKHEENINKEGEYRFTILLYAYSNGNRNESIVKKNV